MTPSELRQSGGAVPTLRETALLAPGQQPEQLEDHPEVALSWSRYLDRWRPWSDEHARRSRIQRLYGALFRAHQILEQLGESFELVVGLGLLTWKTPSGQLVRRHVATVQATLEFDPGKGVLTLRCPGPPEGARPRLELEFLEASERPAEALETAFEEQLHEIGNAIWEKEQTLPALRFFTGALDPDARFFESLVAPAHITETPTVHHAPALILRRRTLRGILRTLQTIIEQLQAGGALPLNVERLVTHIDDVASSGSEPAEGGRPRQQGAQETYFPLPANDEQFEIAERLAQRQGLLVQGPPGTGKSQTIANLVCHLLATGQRVLITSETPRALRVLKDKIPEELRPLCVVLLGADTASFSELEASVAGITQRLAQWDPKRYARDRRNLEQGLDMSRQKLSLVQREQRELRECAFRANVNTRSGRT